MRLGVLIDGEAGDSIEVGNRGFNYGDGAFETLLVQDGRPVWWGEHLARLRRGCEALGLRMPDADLLEYEAEQLCADQARAVLKIVLTRTGHGRGYAPEPGARSQRVLSLHAAPPLLGSDYVEGVTLRWCETRLALQPRLAGFKHLNRLEQVLARDELANTGAFEGLMLDTTGRAVCATAANVFVLAHGRLRTPALRACGIAGICRDWVLTRTDVEIGELLPQDLERADALFLSSSLRGILPVARLGTRRYRPQPLIAGLIAQLWNEVPALAPQA
jgi:4-amino-4-deoxychorismate lyase